MKFMSMTGLSSFTTSGSMDCTESALNHDRTSWSLVCRSSNADIKMLFEAPLVIPPHCFMTENVIVWGDISRTLSTFLKVQYHVYPEIN